MNGHVGAVTHLERVRHRGPADRLDGEFDVDQVSEAQGAQEVGLDVHARMAPVDLVDEPQPFQQGRLGDLDEPERRRVVVVARGVGVRPFDPALDHDAGRSAGRPFVASLHHGALLCSACGSGWASPARSKA